MFSFKKGISEVLMAKAAEANAQSAVRVVFADTDDEVVLACSAVKRRKIAAPILVGDSAKLLEAFKRLGVNNLGADNVFDSGAGAGKSKLEQYATKYIELRSADGKRVSMEEAREKVAQPHYFGAMMVEDGLADAMISGFSSATKPYYPALEIIRTAPGVGRTSGAFIMVDPAGNKMYLFADCVMMMNPTAANLAELAVITARTSECLCNPARVALLSFSTRDSAKHESVDKMKLAMALLKKDHPGLLVDGEIQADAALAPQVAEKKCPDSPLKGTANVLIFPDLNSGNIGYKLVERLGGFEAIGPIMQGLNKPVNDLSRGCSSEDIVKIAAVTVLQARGTYACEGKSIGGPSDEDGNARVKARPRAQISEPKTAEEKQAALDRLPSNIRKIIEEHKFKKKQDKVED